MAAEWDGILDVLAAQRTDQVPSSPNAQTLRAGPRRSTWMSRCRSKILKSSRHSDPYRQESSKLPPPPIKYWQGGAKRRKTLALCGSRSGPVILRLAGFWTKGLLEVRNEGLEMQSFYDTKIWLRGKGQPIPEEYQMVDGKHTVLHVTPLGDLKSIDTRRRGVTAISWSLNGSRGVETHPRPAAAGSVTMRLGGRASRLPDARAVYTARSASSRPRALLALVGRCFR